MIDSLNVPIVRKSFCHGYAGDRWLTDWTGLGGVQFYLPTRITYHYLDVKDVKFVINFDMPNNIEDYVHRIGRTGRANTTGTSITFFTSDNSKLARELVGVLKEAGQLVEPALEQMAIRPTFNNGGRGGGGRGFRGGSNARFGRGTAPTAAFNGSNNSGGYGLVQMPFLSGANAGWSGLQY